MDLPPNLTSIIISIITSAATILVVIVQSRNTDKTVKETSKATNDQIELNNTRATLLLYIKSYPELQSDIYELARHYFEDLGGNSTAVNAFDNWLTANNAEPPEWFLRAKQKHTY